MNITQPNYPKVNTSLENGAKLEFNYPNPDGPGAPDYVRTCPFFENPTIKEARSANLIKYDAIGRSGTLFGYTGAKSRSFDVNFTITLPLLLQLSQGSPLEKIPTAQTKEEQKQEFFQAGGDAAVFDADRNTYSFEALRDSFTRQFTESEEPVSPTETLGPQGKQLKGLFGPGLGYPGLADTTSDKLYRDAISLVMYWVNLVRSSVLTYAPNPSVGPPIVRLSFGTLYQNIPTIVEKYSMTIDDKAGYDVISLLPKRITFSLTLHEIRANAGAGFEQGTQTDRDRLTGWEAVIGRATVPSVDPGRTLWSGGL